jgi:arylsulfatase B
VRTLPQAIGFSQAPAESNVQASVLLFYSGADSNLEGQAEQAVNARVSELRGVRTPALVRWPAGGLSGGSKVDGMMGLIDVYPTLKRLAGVTSEAPNPLDGIDVLDVMRGKKKAPVRDWFSYIAQAQTEQTALCDGTWKLVVIGGSVLDATLDGGDEQKPKVELFRLDRDPSESENLLKSNPAVAAAMLQRLQAFKRLKIDNIPHFLEGKEGFEAPNDWMIK